MSTVICFSSSNILEPGNIRLGWKWRKMTNALAYYGSELITATLTTLYEWLIYD